MRTFVAGGSGVLGRRLIPLLVAAGHTVGATTRSADRLAMVEALGAQGVLFDAYDRAAVHGQVAAFAPDLVINQLTALPNEPERLNETVEANIRIRTEGLGILLSAAEAAGVARFASQSVAWTLPGDAGRAVEFLEKSVLSYGGLVLRYGRLYGPDTFSMEPPPPPRIHVDEAAARTVSTLDEVGVVTITENDREWRDHASTGST